MPTFLRMRPILTPILLQWAAVHALARMRTATLNGVIADPIGGVVPDVPVSAVVDRQFAENLENLLMSGRSSAKVQQTS